MSCSVIRRKGELHPTRSRLFGGGGVGVAGEGEKAAIFLLSTV